MHTSLRGGALSRAVNTHAGSSARFARRVVSRQVGLATTLVLLLAACASQMQMGNGGSLAQGNAGAGGNSDYALARCEVNLGPAALDEPTSEVLQVLGALRLGSPNPVLRLLMAQSGCFRVVDRGSALRTIEQEQELRRRGLLQESSVTAQGTMLALRYIITPQVIFSESNAGGASVGAAIIGRLSPVAGLLAGGLGSMRVKEAQVMLFVTDARTGEQIAIAEGSARARDFAGAGVLGAIGGGIGGLAGVSGYGNTNEGKLVVAALIDAFNGILPHLEAESRIAGGLQPPAAPPRGIADDPTNRAPPGRSGAPAFTSAGSYTPKTAVNIRTGASTSASIIRTVSPGVELITTGERQGSWWRVRGEGFTGWVFAVNLRPLR